MASPNLPCLKLRFFFSIAIIALALASESCEAKHFETLSQSSLNPNSYHENYSLNTPTLDSNFVLPRNYDLLMQDSINAVSKSFEDFGENGILSQEINYTANANLQSATSSCRGLLSLASYNLNISRGRKALANSKIDLCSILAYIDTCSDDFDKAPEKARNIAISSLDSSREKVKNILSFLATDHDEHDRNLGSINGGSASRNAWPPSWMSPEEGNPFDMKRIRTDVVVAKDGSGRFKTISEAIKIAPQNSRRRFVIYVKQGKYYENVRIDESKWNIMIYGDGMYKTVVSGNLCASTGHTIMDSPTFDVRGRGFIALNMGFENTAGPSGQQAVALLSTSDESAFYKCSISGYQDTLFAFTGRQFYRECVISGTIDFIFGQASAVFQRSSILVRRPMPGQDNVITAQAKNYPQCPGGFSFQNCWVKASENLLRARTFLGRPWRKHSTVVFMESYLGELIDPQGWTGWQQAVPYDTVYYGEYKNWGPGSGTGQRVKGVKRSISDKEAYGFTVRKFIGGGRWVPASGISCQLDL